MRRVHVRVWNHTWHHVMSIHHFSLVAVGMSVLIWDLILVMNGSMIWVKLRSVDNRLVLRLLLLLVLARS